MAKSKKSEVEASGAIIGKSARDEIDMSHPSVDNAPREGASEDSNKIDFNTPSALQGAKEQVEEDLD